MNGQTNIDAFPVTGFSRENILDEINAKLAMTNNEGLVKVWESLRQRFDPHLVCENGAFIAIPVD